MFFEPYQALRDRLQKEVPKLKQVGYQQGQLETGAELIRPAVLIGFTNWLPERLGDNSLLGEADVELVLVQDLAVAADGYESRYEDLWLSDADELLDGVLAALESYQSAELKLGSMKLVRAQRDTDWNDALVIRLFYRAQIWNPATALPKNQRTVSVTEQTEFQLPS